MKNTMTMMKWSAVVCTFICAMAAQAAAQTPDEYRGYVKASVGAQAQSRSFTEVSTPVIYDEAAQITVPHEVGAGLLFDVGGGVRVWRSLSIGIGYSHFSDSDSPTLTAQIPNPLLVSSPRTASGSAGDLNHSESAVNIEFSWLVPVSSKFRVTAIAGPSFISVKQDLVSTVTPVESAPPFATVTLGGVAVDAASAWAKGFNVGVDGTYIITPTVGAGVFVRFLGGTVDLTSATGNTVSVDAGGFQVGAGIRYLF